MASSNVDTRTWLTAYIATFISITTLFLAVRILARFKSGIAALGIDDVFIFLSWIVSIAMGGMSIAGAKDFDFSRHLADVPQSTITTTIEIAWALNVLYLVQTTFLKLSVLTMYRRASKEDYSFRLKWTIWAFVSFVVVYNLVLLIIYLTQCIPIAATWMLYNASYASTAKFYCAGNSQNMIVAWIGGILGIGSDFLTILLISWLFVRSRRTLRNRIAIRTIACIGFLILTPSSFRLHFLVRAESAHADKVWEYFNANVAGKAEGDIGIICACIPCFGVLFGRYFEDREGALSPVHNPRAALSRTGSLGHTRARSRTHSRSRSRERSNSQQSMQSMRFDHTNAPSTGPSRDLERGPAPGVRKIFGWNSDSLSFIPEAYSEDVGKKAPRSVSEAMPKDYGGRKSTTPTPSRPDTGLSWLNLDGNSSTSEDDDAVFAGQWYRSEFSKPYA